MKKILSLLTVAFVLFATLAVFPISQAQAVSGTFEGVGAGKHGEVKVELTIEDDVITDIKVIESGENEVLAEPVYDELKEEILGQNSVEGVDVISGSSETSNGYLEAVADAIKNSGVALAVVAKKEKEMQDVETDRTYDVVVVGGGGAGLSAAIEAAQAGKKVVLIEKMPTVGGNTLISGGEMNAPGNWVQEKLGIKGDSVETYYEDTFKGGDEKGNPDMVKLLAENALKSAEWLRDEVKVEFLEDKLFQFGGHSYKRALIPVGHTGQELITKLKAKAEEEGVEILVNTPATKLVKENDKVTGVVATVDETDVTFHANDGVILTAGGFGANVSMRKEYNPEMDERYLTTVSKGSMGDGVIMAQEVGAAITNMESIQTYPVANPETGVISLLADTRFDGAILVNQEGNRFVEELDRRDVISKAILAQTGEYAYQLWNQEIDDISHSKEVHESEYHELLEAGLLVEAETLEEAAKFFNIDPAALQATVDKVNQYAKDGKDKDFNHRGGLKSLEKGPYLLQKVKPSVHHTMGGLVINEKAQVLNDEGQVIEGLYAAGEVTGVIHGANRLGGNAITDIITFGRIAGQEISK